MQLQKLLTLIALVFLVHISFAQPENRFRGNTSVPHEELIEAYKELDAKCPNASLIEIGKSDVGRPIHMFVIDASGVTNLQDIDPKKQVLMINNGIHPGEPCGVDASLRFSRMLLNGDLGDLSFLNEMTICIIPMYNVGGALNRGCCSRANQNGPEMYGFRGNARNLDLNRDFIKCDASNTVAFETAFRALDPDVLIDTHTSNGADYQYTMTLITTQIDKLGYALGTFVDEVFEPALFTEMDNRGWPMSPYVNHHGETPDSGITAFMDSPRYCTGYAALFGTIGFTTETHMLKPFEDRVESTFQFIVSTMALMKSHKSEIQEARTAWKEAVMKSTKLPVSWKHDETKIKEISFMGFEAEHPKSEVTNQPRLYYNREKPITVNIPFANVYQADQVVAVPEFYIVPQAWHEAVMCLEMNGLKMTRFEKDTTMMVGVYVIDDLKSNTRPYEGHFIHSLNKWSYRREEIQLFDGDYLVSTHQEGRRYIVETLEPMATDAFFRWNFFDSVLQQKEWYSDYVFEDTAARMLKEDAALKREFDNEKASNPEFATSAEAQLYWLYKKSPMYEPSVNRYPIYRIEK